MWKAVLRRFLRGGATTAVASMVALLPSIPASGGWSDLRTWCAALAYSAIVGFISGALLSIDKAIRYKE